MSIEIRLLGPGDTAVLDRVANGVFDDPLDAAATRAFVDDSRHHLAVAIDAGVVVGFVSAVHYVHPDKPRPELWINEVSVAETHRERGLGKQMMGAILAVGKALSCAEAWVLTERDNTPAMRLYASLGGAPDPGDTVMFTYFLDEPASD